MMKILYKLNIMNRIKSSIKRNSFFAGLGYKIRFLYYRSSMFLCRRVKVKPNKVLFCRGGDGYGDNCRAVSECLYKVAPYINQIWVYFDKKTIDSLPKYVKPVKFESMQYFYELSSSSAWIFSTLIPDGVLKKDNQLYIQTWHGDRGFKKILNDAVVSNKNYSNIKKSRKLTENKICNYIVTGSVFAEKVFRSAMGYEGEFLKIGCPRNDCLLDKDNVNYTIIRNNLNIYDKKVLLYAPTFRDRNRNEEDVPTDLNISIILDELEKNTRTKWYCLKRAHGGQELKTKIVVKDQRILDMTQYPDMADLLLISDLLITDYSSCAGDFCYTGNPIILYHDDYEEYVKKDRELYYKIEDSPFYVARSMNDLVNIIKSINREVVDQNDKEIIKFFGAYESGHASKSVCQVILEHINSIGC